LSESVAVDERSSGIESFDAEHGTDHPGDDRPQEGADNQRSADPHVVGGGQPPTDGGEWRRDGG
jgi:hypothetical protein